MIYKLEGPSNKTVKVRQGPLDKFPIFSPEFDYYSNILQCPRCAKSAPVRFVIDFGSTLVAVRNRNRNRFCYRTALLIGRFSCCN